MPVRAQARRWTFRESTLSGSELQGTVMPVSSGYSRSFFYYFHYSSTSLQQYIWWCLGQALPWLITLPAAVIWDRILRLSFGDFFLNFPLLVTTPRRPLKPSPQGCKERRGDTTLRNSIAAPLSFSLRPLHCSVTYIYTSNQDYHLTLPIPGIRCLPWPTCIYLNHITRNNDSCLLFYNYKLQYAQTRQ